MQYHLKKYKISEIKGLNAIKHIPEVLSPPQSLTSAIFLL